MAALTWKPASDVDGFGGRAFRFRAARVAPDGIGAWAAAAFGPSVVRSRAVSARPDALACDIDGDSSWRFAYQLRGRRRRLGFLRPNDFGDLVPVWSPDRTKVAFTTDRDGDYEIYVMNPDGSGQTNVSNSPGSIDFASSWQPLPDVTAPVITITTPPEGAVYTLGQVLADYACEDEAGGSGLASCIGDVPDGTPLDTSSVGAKTFTVTAADNAGNQALQTHAYSVVYDFSGFFPPVDNTPVFNMVKAGSAIPVKFSLGGDQGLGIFATGYPKSQPIPCDASATYDGIEETVTAGSSSLSYDATTDRYHYVWKTDKAWANTCRQLVVKLIDGTIHQANFTFKK